MKKLLIYGLAVALLAGFYSCDEELDIWESSTTELDGNWYVQYDIEGETDPHGYGLTPLFTYNTAANDGQEIWITDEENFWDYKVRVSANPENLTFGSDDTVTNQVDGYAIGVTVRNGKIIQDAATLASGVTVDSIYFEVKFEDADATYLVSGHRKSGFEEDELH